MIVEDYVVLGGFSGIHQFCKLGAYSFIGRAALVVKDVLPYVLVAGHDSKAIGLNLVGLKRWNFSPQTTDCLRRAYKIIFRSHLTVQNAIKELDMLVTDCPEVQLMIDMLKNSERGVTR